MNMYENDTITAISTPYGTGGIGIVRISGEKAFSIASCIFKGRKPFDQIKSHTISYGKIVDPDNGQVLDEVLISKMAKPNTFTREDVVEINCHGGIAVVKKVLELVIRQGARLAEPGEFTKRAFLNGRIDLSQAEAVIDIICSKTEESSKAALNQLEGKLSFKIKEARKKLIELIAHIEASIDFPEHDIDDITEKVAYETLGEIQGEIGGLLKSFEKGRIIKEGINAVIVGKPNVGKSTLLNELTGKNRAIVTDIPGTTRDIIEDYINIKGIPVRITDTAGIRQTEDTIEKIGVDKTIKAIEAADLIIFMADASGGIGEDDLKILERMKNKKVVVLINKVDLLGNSRDMPGTDEFKGLPVVHAAVKYAIGLEELEAKIEELFLKGDVSVSSEVLITNVRHKNLLDSAAKSIAEARAAIEQGLPIDFAAIDIRDAASHLGQITGESVSEDVIEEIFSRFCIGK